MKTGELVAFTVRLTAEEREALQVLATASHRSLGAEARTAIVAHLERDTEREAA